MSPFWNNLFLDVGRNGRNGGGFFVSVILSGLSVFILLFGAKYALGNHYRLFLGCLGVAILFAVLRKLRKIFRRHPVPKIREMSREELRLARSKLLGNQPNRKL